MRHVLFICAAFCLLVSGLAMAYPTLDGPTGLVTLPNADVAKPGEFTLSGNVFTTKDNTTGADTTYYVNGLYGVLGCFEVGAGYWTGSGNDTWQVNGKYQTPICVGGFNTAVGVIYTDSRPPRTDLRVTQFYVAGTRTFVDGRNENFPAFKATLGANLTEFTGGFVEGKETGIRGFASGELIFKNGVTAGLELQTKNTDDFGEGDPVWGVILRYPINDSLNVHAAYAKWDAFRGPSNGDIFVGFDYSL